MRTPAIFPTMAPMLRESAPELPEVPVRDDLRRGGNMLMPLFNSEWASCLGMSLPLKGEGGVELHPLFMTARWTMIVLPQSNEERQS